MKKMLIVKRNAYGIGITRVNNYYKIFPATFHD